MKRHLLRTSAAWVTAVSLFNPALLVPSAHADVLSPDLLRALASAENGKIARPVTGPFNEPALTVATSKGTTGASFATDPKLQGLLTPAQKLKLLQKKIKYVFILYQENRSYDSYFGTYPGANGLYSTYNDVNKNDPYAQPANVTASFTQDLLNTDGTVGTITPFLLPRTVVNQAGATTQIWPEDTYSVTHAHSGYINDFHLDAATESVAKNDGYALTNEGFYYPTAASGPTAPIYSTSTNAVPTTFPTLRTKQEGEIAMSHVDCDTIPFLWQYADRFTMFDNFHQTAIGPSTPNAIALIAGQVGDTQWVEHGSVGYAPDGKTPSLSVPNLTDNGPFAGSSYDTTSGPKPPYGPDEASNANADTNGNFAANDFQPNANLTFASLPLSFLGSQASSVAATDENAPVDLADVQEDLLSVAKNKAVNWGWFQEGYDNEPFDGTSISENAKGIVFAHAPDHASYIVHHNGPQYFGYVGDNPAVESHLHGQHDFYYALANNLLPAAGGVAYVRGGYYNEDNMTPADPNATVQASTPGNDDHPNYSDAGISEASVADSVNAIAQSKYWKNSVIIITYDETDGLYDHQPEQFRTFGPDKLPETGGPRIPAIVISPFASSHVISHVYSEHSAVIRFIDELFKLTPLADLPDEAAARSAGAGNAAFNTAAGQAQGNLGPADDPTTMTNDTSGMGNLFEAFDDYRLLGIVPTLPATLAEVPSNFIHTLPAYAQGTGASATYGCQYLGITPTDYPNGYGAGKESDAPPQDFNPRPAQSPGEPYLNINYNSGTEAASPAKSTGTWDPQ